MAKLPSSVVGIDFGRHSMKSVVLQRRGNRFHLTNYAVEEITRPIETEDQLAEAVKSHLKTLNGKAKAYAVAVSSPTMILRIIEQPETPAEQLRDIVRLNGMSLLNQDCKDFVLDCDVIGPANSQVPEGQSGNLKYLVGGVPRAQITHLDGALQKTGVDVSLIQLAPICSFNAFEFAYEDIFSNQAFVLVDLGHESSTVTVGVKKELILIRSIEYGGKDLIEALTSSTGLSRRE
ncbi:MAG: pilus assembly protein PilM, partial [Verrucomicrobiota bacterium]|nr:pilus assembly protein PilM [Verrucomicrobiota bacterium]